MSGKHVVVGFNCATKDEEMSGKHVVVGNCAVKNEVGAVNIRVARKNNKNQIRGSISRSVAWHITGLSINSVPCIS